MRVPEVEGEEAIAMREHGAAWIDVREQYEWDDARIADTTLVPMQQSIDWIAQHAPDPSTQIIVSCHSGARSGNVVAYLRQQGYSDVHNLRGGIQLWAMQGRPVVRGPEA